jgi:hypothetical protein
MGRRPIARAIAAIVLGGAAYAAAELLVTIFIGRFFQWGRAEPALFLAFRPWLMLVAALLTARWGWRQRLSFYAAALTLATVSQWILLWQMGGTGIVAMVLRGLAAGALLWLVIDLTVQAAYHRLGRWGLTVAAALIVLVYVLPGAMRPYEALALGTDRQPEAGEKPQLMLMTGLPIIWGEGGAFDPESRPAAAYRALQAEFEVRPLDVLDQESLGQGRLLLLAQPNLLQPTELAAFDAWVRRGGRTLILADPALLWPTDLPFGDIRRPPPVSFLGPLMRHWGLSLEEPQEPALRIETLPFSEGAWRLAMAAPGRFVAEGDACQTQFDWLAHCTIVEGQAVLIADADLLHDRMWTAPGEGGESRTRRLADNPVVIAEMLDRLGGMERDRSAQRAVWADKEADANRALLLAMLPLLLAGGVSIPFLFRSRNQIEK